MANNIDSEKLVTNLKVKTSNSNSFELYFNQPVDLQDSEELVIVRRKDSFPVELRNKTYEDRYTDLAQVEIYRASTIYCSNLVVQDNKLVFNGNTFIPTNLTSYERNEALTGRLIRDSNSQVFRITGNTETELFWENISKNPDDQILPENGPFVILPDFKKERTYLREIPLLSNTFTITLNTYTFS
jgi:hypothetical protein